MDVGVAVAVAIALPPPLSTQSTITVPPPVPTETSAESLAAVTPVVFVPPVVLARAVDVVALVGEATRAAPG
jgi:hypothetical protein